VTVPSGQTVLILGTGLAGLTAAYHLHQQGYQVTLLDHPEWLDGFRTNASDVAPILCGCHHETRRLLHALDGQRASKSDRTILLEFRLPNGQVVPYLSARLPGAFQWMMSLFSFHGLAWKDRWRLFSHIEQIWEQAQTLPADLENRTAEEWLTTIGQSSEAQAQVWSPLAHWLTGNALACLSAATFVQQLSTVFLSHASDAKLISLSGSVADRFLIPIKQMLPQHTVRTFTLTHQPDLQFGSNGVNEIRLHDGTTLHARWYILALSYQHVLPLIPERLLTRYAYFAHVAELKSLGAITVHMKYRAADQPPRLLLLTGRPFHQLTRTAYGTDELEYQLSVVGNSFVESATDQVLHTANTEIDMLLSGTNKDPVISQTVFREPHAALRLGPGAARLRPLQQSPFHNLLVAGSWTDTGWPANIESALISARRCAEIIAGHTA
jgi:hypothetical protein